MKPGDWPYKVHDVLHQAASLCQREATTHRAAGDIEGGEQWARRALVLGFIAGDLERGEAPALAERLQALFDRLEGANVSTLLDL